MAAVSPVVVQSGSYRYELLNGRPITVPVPIDLIPKGIPLVGRVWEPKRRVILLRSFMVSIPDLQYSGRVSAAFTSDGGSIPRTFQPILPAWERGFEGFLVHDWEYFLAENRRRADEVLYYMLRANGVSGTKARAIWSAVRLWGGPAFRACSKGRSSARIDRELLARLRAEYTKTRQGLGLWETVDG